MNLLRRKYTLDPETLRFTEKKLKGKKLVISLLLACFIILVSAVGMRYAYDAVAKSPRLVYYEKQNEMLRGKCEILNSELEYAEERLAELQLMDDKLYRSIFGLDPLAADIRGAGIGGAPRYASLQSLPEAELITDVSRRLDHLENKANIQSTSFEKIEEVALETKQLLASKPSIKPISPADRVWLTSTFGYRPDPFTKRRKLHHGIDLAGQVGLAIYATGDGVVEVAEFSKYGYGNEVVLDHGFGFTSIYAHLDEIFVEEGDKIERGQLVGTLGNTGRSTGPHLHYEVRFNNSPVNPMYYYHEDLTVSEYEILTSRASVE